MTLIFKKPGNDLETGGFSEIKTICSACGRSVPESELWDNLNVCRCGYHFKLKPRQRLAVLTDPGSFQEIDSDMESRNLIGFEGYESKLEHARLSSGEKEGVVCGLAEIEGSPCALFVMDPYFMLGSMGTVMGEKITKLFELAEARRLSVVGFTVSGGARMQEGILSLMQMAKVSGAVKRHSDAGLFYMAVLTDPTTGGVTASFAMLGDVIMCEPGATVGFAGARVIEQTIRKKLPKGFQTAEFTMEHGFVDMITPRIRQKDTISRLLKLHAERSTS